jgi:hypothetical protein
MPQLSLKSSSFMSECKPLLAGLNNIPVILGLDLINMGGESTYIPFCLSSKTVLPIKCNRSTYQAVLPIE